MSSLYAALRAVKRIFSGKKLTTVQFGFGYKETRKIMDDFGDGCLFFGNGDAEDLKALEERLKKNQRFDAVFTEFPGNFLLQAPDLSSLSALAKEYEFLLIIDDTVATFANGDFLPYCNIVASSLTKFFSGKCNVMGGSLIVSPFSPHYEELKKALAVENEKNLFISDAIILEEQSRDFYERMQHIKDSANKLAEWLSQHPLVTKVLYPTRSQSREIYDRYKKPEGGYGGLLSFLLHNTDDTPKFFDSLDFCKGPSLGTNFTLVCPQAILGHYNELEEMAKYGALKNLIRVSVGLEPLDEIKKKFENAFETIS